MICWPAVMTDKLDNYCCHSRPDQSGDIKAMMRLYRVCDDADRPPPMPYRWQWHSGGAGVVGAIIRLGLRFRVLIVARAQHLNSKFNFSLCGPLDSSMRPALSERWFKGQPPAMLRRRKYQVSGNIAHLPPPKRYNTRKLPHTLHFCVQLQS